jgi:hypothetical protein
VACHPGCAAFRVGGAASRSSLGVVKAALPLIALLSAAAAELPAQQTTWSQRGIAGEDFGAALAPVGDWDRDGILDWAAGAPYGGDDHGTTGGYVRVLSGRSGAELNRFSGPAGQGGFGAALAAAGDVDRDGIPDLLVGAPRAEGQAARAGLAQVWSGGTGELLLEFRGAVPHGRFGASVAGIGDVDGDGRPDLLVGAPGDDTGGRDCGAAAVFSGLDGSLLHLIRGSEAMELFGAAVSGVGDVDDDGRDDFLVGAPGAGEQEAGSVLLFSGATGELLRIESGARPGAAFGTSVAFAGDLDEDGFGDWMAGAPGVGSGTVSVYSGRTGSLIHHLVGPSLGSRFGEGLSAAGDLDRDGVHDIVVGAPRDPLGGVDAGSVTAYSGRDGRVVERWLGEPGERAGSVAAPLDPTLREAGFVSSGRGRKDLGVVRLRRWKPARAAAAPVAAAPVSNTAYASPSAGYSSSSSTVVTTRFYFYYWGSGCGPWWGYYWSPYTWWPYHSRCHWWGPPRYWWWTCWDPCFSCGYDPCCCGSYWDQGSGNGSGSNGSNNGGTPPPPPGPVAVSPSPVGGGLGSGAGGTSLTGTVGGRTGLAPAGSSAGLAPSGSATGGGALGRPGSGSTTLKPAATTVRVPLAPAPGGSGGASVAAPPSIGSRYFAPRVAQPVRPVAPPSARAQPPARNTPAPRSTTPPRSTPPPRATPPARSTPPPRSTPPARSAPPPRTSGPPRSSSPPSGVKSRSGGGGGRPKALASAKAPSTPKPVSRPAAAAKPAPRTMPKATPRPAAKPKAAPKPPAVRTPRPAANRASAGAASRGSRPAGPGRARRRS